MAATTTTDVLIVDDSPTARLALRRALERDPSVRVVGEAVDEKTALAMVEALKPNLVTMDVYLRDEDGIEVTAALMGRLPVPILIVTSRDPRDPQLVYRAIEAGALDLFGKLPGESNPGYEAQRQRLVRVVKALSRVRVLRRRRRYARATTSAEPGPAAERAPSGIEAVLLGASTGGPPVLGRILEQIRPPAPLPVVIVQHMAAGFGEGFAGWLSTVTGHQVAIVDRPQPIEPGKLYLAPAGQHLIFSRRDTLGLSDDPPRFYQKPSVDVLFESAAEVLGSAAVAVLLTGMGRDGAAGLKALKDAGAQTLTQEPSTCSVASMPEAAIEAGAANAVLAPEEIAGRLVTIFATLRT